MNRKYNYAIFGLLLISIVIGYVSFLFNKYSTNENNYLFWSNLFMGVLTGTIVGLALIWIEKVKRLNLENMASKIYELETVVKEVRYLSEEFKFDDPEIGYYYPYDEYYHNFKFYIENLEKNIYILERLFLSLHKPLEKSIKEIVKSLIKKKGTTDSEIARVIKNSKELIEKLLLRKKEFERITKCIELELLYDVNFMNNRNDDYANENGYFVDNKLFLEAEKLVNKMYDYIVEPVNITLIEYQNILGKLKS